MNVTVFASQIAALIGMHKYQDADQALVDQWYMTDVSGCIDAIVASGKQSAADHVLTKQQFKLCEDTVTRAASAPDAQAFRNTLDAVQDTRVRKIAESSASKSRGCLQENSAIDTYEKQHNKQVRERNSQLFKKQIRVSGDTITVMGRVDGIIDGNEITEMKNRMRGFFAHVPLYEKVQTQTYLWLTGMSRCRLVQHFHGQTKEDIIERDEGFWNDDIVPGLTRFMGRLSILLNSSDELHESFTRELLVEKNLLPAKYVEVVQKRVNTHT